MFRHDAFLVMCGVKPTKNSARLDKRDHKAAPQCHHESCTLISSECAFERDGEKMFYFCRDFAGRKCEAD